MTLSSRDNIQAGEAEAVNGEELVKLLTQQRETINDIYMRSTEFCFWMLGENAGNCVSPVMTLAEPARCFRIPQRKHGCKWGAIVSRPAKPRPSVE